MSDEKHLVDCSVKFLNSKNKVAGSGFWVLPDGHGLTCHHVIVRDSGQSPERVKVQFMNRVLHVRYVPELSSPEHDVAAFKLIEDGVAPVPFVRLARAEKPDKEVRVWGYRKDFFYGYLLSGTLRPGQDFACGSVYNLNSSMPDGSSVCGMSGGPVLDPQSESVVGLLYAEEIEGPSVAYVHPIEKVFDAWPDLPARNAEAYQKAPHHSPLEKGLAEHLNYQRWLFEEAPVLGRSPFALQHIYVDTECGYLTWGQIHPPGQPSSGRRAANAEEERPKNPFSERDGERRLLLDTVKSLIGDPHLREPIIVQGIAGSGKSSFTLKLCADLQSLGLVPILIRFKDIRLDKQVHISEVLPQAVRLNDSVRSPGVGRTTPGDLFRKGEIFGENGSGEYSHISRYVLILDGWDEISVANEGFKKRIERMLEQIRGEYVDNHALPLPLRLVITGRPTAEVNSSGFLHSNTPILTLRPLNPDHLQTFIGKLTRAVADHPLAPPDEDVWPPLDSQRVAPLIERYKIDFARLLKSEDYDIQNADLQTGSLGVLGLPLLAQLTARLVAESEHSPEQLMDNPTELYRRLVDLTCSKGGKPHGSATADEIAKQSRIYGWQLRSLLWRTAEAMTTYGKDVIPYEVLRKRLKLSEDALDTEVADVAERRSLTSLLISFYFKGGFRHTGCEFAHKSFREYLLAEALVEELKKYGASALPPPAPRAKYWQDFGADDPRRGLSRRLAELLAPQWPRPEIMFHVSRLIEWEIKRAAEGAQNLADNTSTDSISSEEWERVRDGLADLWDWWGDGVHLRSQPLSQAGDGQPAEPYVVELVNYAYDCYPRSPHFGPPRTTTMDSHLGYGLFSLCVWVHYFIAVTESALRISVRERGGGRVYQSLTQGEDGVRVRFAPAGAKPEYFTNYIYRIASAGIRQTGWFPSHADLRGVDLTGATLSNVDFQDADLSEAILREAALSNVDFSNANLARCDLSKSNLSRVYFAHTNLTSANLASSNLHGVSFISMEINDADMSDINLSDPYFSEVKIMNTEMAGTNWSGGQFDDVRFCSDTDLTKANFHGSYFRDVTIVDTDITGATFPDVNVVKFRYEKVRFTGDDPLCHLDIDQEQVDELPAVLRKIS